MTKSTGKPLINTTGASYIDTKISNEYKPKIIAVYNDKGGVGKSCTTVQLSYEFARHHKVLVIDLDGQKAGTTISFPFENDDKIVRLLNITDYFQKELHLQDIIENIDSSVAIPLTNGEEKIVETTPNLYILPANIGTNNLKESLMSDEAVTRLLLEIQELDFEYVFIDVGPSPNAGQQLALKLSQYMIIPLITEYKALEGISALIDKCNYINSECVRVLGFIVADLGKNITKKRLTRFQQDMKTWVEDAYNFFCKNEKKQIFMHVLSNYPAIDQSLSLRLGITYSEPNSAAGKAYYRFIYDVAKSIEAKDVAKYIGKIVKEHESKSKKKIETAESKKSTTATKKDAAKKTTRSKKTK